MILEEKGGLHLCFFERERESSGRAEAGVGGTRGGQTVLRAPF